MLGLRFLARHLVTFDFPHHTLYLQRQSAVPPPTDRYLAKDALLKSLVIRDGKLPVNINASLNAELKTESLPWRFRWFGGTMAVKMDGEADVWHYTVRRHLWHGPWQVKRAWQTGPDGKTVADFKIH